MKPTPVEKQELIDKYGNERCFALMHHRMNHIPDLFSEADKEMDLTSYDNPGRYILRSDAEMNMAFQQVIPYAIIKKKGKEEYFVAKRIAGDTRLVKSLSIGFGGHIDPIDGHNNVIMNGLKRELDEELLLTSVQEPQLIGTVRDLSSSTADHTGFVFIVEVSDAKIKETDKMSGEWMSLDKIVDSHFGSLESWSKYCIDYLYTKNKTRETV